MIQSHLLNMLIYSALVSLVFAILSREQMRDRARYGMKLFAIMTVGSLLLAWLMLPFPRP